MNDITPHVFLYSANLIFILTNLYGWFIKKFYKAEPYRDNYDNLFPSQKANATLYLLQIFEIPYLLMLPNPKALFYVNAFSILIFSSMMVIMQEGYFFLKQKRKRSLIRFFLPVLLIVTYLLLAATGVLTPAKNNYQIMFWIVTAVFLYYVFRLLILKRNIRQSIRAVEEGAYSNSDDFPVRFAKRIEWVPIIICALMFACFVFNDPRVKMWRDLLFTIVNVWFLFDTLHPHRKGVKREEKLDEELDEVIISCNGHSTRYKLSDQRCREIESKLIELMEKEKLFLDSHLTVDQLSQKLGVNRNYISEVVARSNKGSFYTLINSYRLECAKEMLRQDPTLKIKHVAYDSGFSSVSVFSQVFKRYTNMSPTMFVKTILSDKNAQ